MNRQEVVRQLEQMLKGTDGATAGVAITERTRPITDLGLESVDGIDCVLRLEDSFKIALPEGCNPFVNDEKRCARTVGEIADMVLSSLRSSREETDA